MPGAAASPERGDVVRCPAGAAPRPPGGNALLREAAWQLRYLVYEGALGPPRTGLAAMWAEGQLPKPLDLTPVAAGGRRVVSVAR
jgi:hypothetical protein